MGGAVQSPSGAASIATLPETGAWVRVGPPLSARVVSRTVSSVPGGIDVTRAGHETNRPSIASTPEDSRIAVEGTVVDRHCSARDGTAAIYTKIIAEGAVVHGHRTRNATATTVIGKITAESTVVYSQRASIVMDAPASAVDITVGNDRVVNYQVAGGLHMEYPEGVVATNPVPVPFQGDFASNGWKSGRQKYTRLQVNHV